MIPKPFQGLKTFCKVSEDNSLHYTVVGFPTDTATTFRPGARFAPGSIRNASAMLTDGEHSSYRADLKRYVADLGDAEITVGNTLKMLDQVQTIAKNILDHNKHPVFLGGDHTITLGILRAIKETYGKVAVVHFDAHCDTWNTNFDEPIGHGTWLYNAIEEQLVNPTKVISIGVRSPADEKASTYLDRNGGTTFTARYAHSNMEAVISNVLHLVGNTPVYLTFDIDAIDPAYAPGTGTPEIGGLTTMWVLECLEKLQSLNWVGMDLVEVSPAYDHAEITSLAAATICWTYLSMNIAKNKNPATTTPEDETDLCGASIDDNEDFVPSIEKEIPGPVGPTGPIQG